jgi:hypothetical protein
MTSCLMSSRKELLLLRIDGAIEAREESYRESLPEWFMLRLGGNSGGAGFSVMVIGVSDGGAEGAGEAGLLALK